MCKMFTHGIYCFHIMINYSSMLHVWSELYNKTIYSSNAFKSAIYSGNKYEIRINGQDVLQILNSNCPINNNLHLFKQ